MSTLGQKGFGNLTQWVVPLGIVVVWQAAASAGFLSTRILPAPSEVLAAGWRLLGTGELARNMWVSFLRAIVGFAIGGGIGFAFGLANGLSIRSEKVFDSTLQMVRNVPHLALIPLVILWFGIDETAKVFLVALGVFFPIYINTLHGIRTVDPQLVEMGRIYGMTPSTLFWRVILPGALLPLRARSGFRNGAVVMVPWTNGKGYHSRLAGRSAPAVQGGGLLFK